MPEQCRSYLMAYPEPGRRGRQQSLLRMRDSEPARYLSTALGDRGYRYTGDIINHNHPEYEGRIFNPSFRPTLIAYDYSFLRESDLIFQVTRPAMHDHLFGDRKNRGRSFMDIEDLVYAAPGACFEICSRPQMVLKDSLAALSPELAKRQVTEFHYYRGATYRAYGPVKNRREWVRFKKDDGLTALFLIYVEHAWAGGPGVLMAFGMGGLETQVWCYRLANDFSHLLCTTSFAMAEMRRGALPTRPTSMEWSLDWEINLLASAPLPVAGDPLRAA
jgi:hypothetical protein